jgi:hypothetical protein
MVINFFASLGLRRASPTIKRRTISMIFGCFAEAIQPARGGADPFSGMPSIVPAISKAISNTLSR